MGRRRNTDWTLWTALFFGLFPDLVSLGIHFSMDLVAGDGMQWGDIPDFVFALYDFTHSLAGMAVGIGLLVAWKRALWLPALAWPLHVLTDVPTHGSGTFMTPIFWPFSERSFAGWNWWEHPWMFYGSWMLAAGLWLGVLVLRRSGRAP